MYKIANKIAPKYLIDSSVAQLDAPSDWTLGGRGFNPRRGRQHSFVEIDHEIFSTVILSLPLIQKGQLSVSGERMYTILVNYRPIFILSTVSKIFEKHVNKHLMAYLNKYKLLHDNQSGFKPKHSCQTALVKLINDWMKCIDKGDLVGALFIDFRKAFDLVDHAILLNKLALYKLNPSAIQ